MPTNKQTKDEVKAQLSELADSLTLGALMRDDQDILLIATCLKTAICAAESREDTVDLCNVLSEFSSRQIKRLQGMSDSEIAVSDLLRRVERGPGQN